MVDQALLRIMLRLLKVVARYCLSNAQPGSYERYTIRDEITKELANLDTMVEELRIKL